MSSKRRHRQERLLGLLGEQRGMLQRLAQAEQGLFRSFVAVAAMPGLPQTRSFINPWAPSIYKKYLPWGLSACLGLDAFEGIFDRS